MDATKAIAPAPRARWSDPDAFPAWAYVDAYWARNGMPDDPMADAADSGYCTSVGRD